MSLPRVRLLHFALLATVVLFGIWLRFPDDKSRERKGADEGTYEFYVGRIETTGWLGWPQLIDRYITDLNQAKNPYLPPPTRWLFLISSSAVHRATGATALESVRWISFLSGVGLLVISVVFSGRLGGIKTALGVGALVATSPLLIHMSHRAMIDGFFAFWATVTLWGAWECLKAPTNRIWLACYGLGLVAMVLTKENAAFVFVAIVAILGLNRWLKIGVVSTPMWITTFFAPLIGVVILILAAGGISPLVTSYRMNVAKSVVLPYAIQTGDGPWHRYLLDFILVSPIVTVLSLAALGATCWKDPGKRYLVCFVAVTYALMCQVRYGMNMRYGAIWEFPMCWLAFAMLMNFAERIKRWQTTYVAASFVALVCASELWQYRVLFAGGNVYDPVPGALVQRLKMWKPL